MNDDAEMNDETYWKTNLRVVGILLAAWFLVSYGLGVVLAEPLNALRIPSTGFPVGFWFAQQGAIYGFLVIVFVYVRVLNRLDARLEASRGPSDDLGAGGRPPPGRP